MTEAEHLREENARLRGLMIPAHAVAPDTSSNASGITFPYLKYGIVRMALHLVGETLDKARSHYMAETGKLVQLMRGIYVDAGDDIDATVLKHAVRIAKYLYPHAYLSAASAALPTSITAPQNWALSGTPTACWPTCRMASISQASSIAPSSMPCSGSCSQSPA